jgi:hypothetical protein
VITSARDAGRTTFDGYRLSADGSLTRARWSGQNALLGVSDKVALDAGDFAQARNVLKDIAASERAAPADGTTGSPALRTYEISMSEGVSPARFVFRDRPTSALSALITEWQAAAPLAEPSGGTFVWAVPVTHDPGQPDITLGPTTCEQADAEGVAAALTSARIAARQPAAQAGQWTIDMTGRQRLIAALPEGFAYFGVLTAD